MTAHDKTLTPNPEITVRDERFNRTNTPSRWWAGEPFGTAWHNALSGTFPRGEAFFIESVKAFREGTDPKLAAEIRAFVKQEINHTREHIAFNRLAADAGYDMDMIDRRTKELLDLAADISALPAVQWKLRNLERLRAEQPAKFERELARLDEALR